MVGAMSAKLRSFTRAGERGYRSAGAFSRVLTEHLPGPGVPRCRKQAPELLCPSCDRPLAYRQTVISGIKPIERWDYFECRTCGSFVYRDRTRRLRPVT